MKFFIAGFIFQEFLIFLRSSSLQDWLSLPRVSYFRGKFLTKISAFHSKSTSSCLGSFFTIGFSFWEFLIFWGSFNYRFLFLMKQVLIFLESFYRRCYFQIVQWIVAQLCSKVCAYASRFCLIWFSCSLWNPSPHNNLLGSKV